MYRQYKICVVIPCLNEEEGIKKVLSEIPSYVDEVIVVDNGSTDNTPLVASSFGARVIKESRRGYGRAYKTGIAAANGDIIVTMDGDGSYPTKEIENLLAPIIEAKADFVSGSRFPLKNKTSMATLNRIGNFALTFCANILFFKSLKDSQSGMWAFPKKNYHVIEPVSDGMAFSQEIKLNSILAKFRFKEVFISYFPRTGVVKLSWFKDGVLNLISILKTRIWFLKKKKQQ